MKITRKQFFIITFLFLLLPFSVNWRLFLFGGQTKAIVIKKTLPVIENNYVPENIDKFSIIRYNVNGLEIEFLGPENIIYPIGKEFTVFYSKKNPKEYVLFSFSGLLMNNKMLLPFALFVLWISFYLTINKDYKKKRTG
jgi:hypothetical protein